MGGKKKYINILGSFTEPFNLWRNTQLKIAHDHMILLMTWLCGWLTLLFGHLVNSVQTAGWTNTPHGVMVALGQVHFMLNRRQVTQNWWSCPALLIFNPMILPNVISLWYYNQLFSCILRCTLCLTAIPWVLWHCWLGDRKVFRPVKATVIAKGSVLEYL